MTSAQFDLMPAAGFAHEWWTLLVVMLAAGAVSFWIAFGPLLKRGRRREMPGGRRCG